MIKIPNNSFKKNLAINNILSEGLFSLRTSQLYQFHYKSSFPSLGLPISLSLCNKFHFEMSSNEEKQQITSCLHCIGQYLSTIKLSRFKSVYTAAEQNYSMDRIKALVSYTLVTDQNWYC